MKIMTYNVHSCIDMKKKGSLDRVMEIIRQERPALVGLNEVENCSPRTGFVNQPKLLAAARDMMVRFGPTLKLGPIGFFGNAVLSRYPILESKNEILPGQGERRCCLTTRVRIPSGFLIVMVTHLGLKHDSRRLQIQALADMVSRQMNPVVLMGDFNSEGEELEPLRKLMNDAGLLGSADPTYPSDQPAHRIDYIFLTPGLTFTGVRVIKSDASDHLPVLTEALV